MADAHSVDTDKLFVDLFGDVDLQSAPTENASRTGRLSLPSLRLAEPEMQLIVDVLEHPKHPPNWLATGVSLVSALILFAKSSRDFWASAVVLHAPDIISLIGLIAGMSASLVIIWSAVDQQIKYSRDVHRKRAIEYAKMEAVG